MTTREKLGGTYCYMISDNYKERFKAEYDQLHIRREALLKVIEGFKAGRLNFKLSCPIELLESQADIMLQYELILLDRADIEGVQL